MKSSMIDYIVQFLLLMLIMIEATLIFSYYSHPKMPANIIGYAPYVIGKDDNVLNLQKGDLMIAKIPNRIAKKDDVVCYRDRETIGMGKVIETSKEWCHIENRSQRIYISHHQVIGIKTGKIPFAGKIFIFITSYMEWLLVGCTVAMAPDIYRYYRHKKSLIYKENKKEERV